MPERSFSSTANDAGNAPRGLAELENTEKVVAIQSEQITRLDGRVEKLEEKVDKLEIIIEHKDVEIDRSRIIIRQAYKCDTPPERCPVLLKRQKFIEQEQAERTRSNDVH